MLCDCHASWLSPWLQSHPGDFQLSLVCAHPIELLGQPLQEVHMSEFTCGKLKLEVTPCDSELYASKSQEIPKRHNFWIHTNFIVSQG